MTLKSSLLSLLLALAAVHTRADEGMWLFTAPPREALESQHDFTVTPEWLDHLMHSAVKMGASAAFVSADGLVLTNHHVGRGHIERLSTPERNLLRDGFVAKSPGDELPCKGIELNVLQSIEDVTARVNAAVSPNADPDTAAKERRRITAEIERDSQEKTGLKSSVVTLYQGGQYHLYRYQRFTDVRLVFAPEYAIAAFGGDADNFEYPRYCLDFCLFRAYENGQPYRPKHFLKWAKTPAKDGDLVFVAGHPGNTDRLLTTAELETRRDVTLPFSQEGAYRSEVILNTWGARSDENLRRTARYLPSIQNGRKARIGQLAALQNPQLIENKERAESRFLSQTEDNQTNAAFTRIADAQKILRATHARHSLLEGGTGFESALFTYARDLLRSAEERTKPDGERLSEYTDAKRASFELTLFAETPIYPDLETVRLANSLGRLAEELGANDSLVVRILAGKSPSERARELIAGTKLADPATRKQLHQGGTAALAAAKDPMIELARTIDAESRELRRAREAVNETVKQAHATIAATRFKLEGTSRYPDATGTLRLSYGKVLGYADGTEKIPALTRTAGLFTRAREQDQRPPFNLPPRWQGKDSVLNPDTPFNFIATCDIVGGNSGSPVVNRNGEFVGIIFDGNLPSLAFAYAYDNTQARCVSVHASIITESLRKIYGAADLVSELETGAR